MPCSVIPLSCSDHQRRDLTDRLQARYCIPSRTCDHKSVCLCLLFACVSLPSNFSIPYTGTPRLSCIHGEERLEPPIRRILSGLVYIGGGLIDINTEPANLYPSPLAPAKMTTNAASSDTNAAHASVLMPSEAIPEDALHIKGPDFNNAITLQDLLTSYEKIGFQATGLAKAIKIIEDMVRFLRQGSS